MPNFTSFMRTDSSTRLQSRKVAQRGFLMLEVGLAILLAAAAAALAAQTLQRSTDATNAMTQAESMNFIRDGIETLVYEKYQEYQQGLPITRNGVTIPPGTSSGQSMQPTVAQLKLMGLGIDNASEQGFYKSLATATYQINVEQEPAGCNAAPNPTNGSACNIRGTVCFSAPVRPYGTNVETDGFGIGKMLGALGANGGVSVEGVEASITGSGGGWSQPNPIAGNPAGIVCSRFGFGASRLANFLRVNDTRDPNFLGGMTLEGNNATGNTLQVNGATAISSTLNVGGASTFEGDISVRDAAATECIRLLNAGQIDINCAGILNAKTGSFTAANGAVKIGNNTAAFPYGVVTTGNGIFSEQGLQGQAGGIYTPSNTNGVKYSDVNPFTAIGAAGTQTMALHDAGRLGVATSVGTGVLGMSRVVNVGDACVSAGTVVPSTNAQTAASTALASLGNGGVASCINGIWTAISRIAQPGSSCTLDGTQAVSNVDGRALVCKNSVYMQVNDLLSPFVLMNTYRVADGSVIAKPTCGQLGSGVGQAVPLLTGQVESSTNASFNRRTDDLGTAWRVVLQDSNGNSLAGSPSGEGLLAAYCYY